MTALSAGGLRHREGGAGKDVRSAADATDLIKDSRAAHFWDRDQTLAKTYAKILGLPPDDLAWDVYRLFPEGVRWDERAPRPAYWMHQISYPSDNYLDGRKFRLEVEKLLPSGPKSQTKHSFVSEA
jgi:hypothetical protein